MKNQTRKSRALRQMKDAAEKLHTEIIGDRKRFGQEVELWQSAPGIEATSQDEVIRLMLLQEKGSLLDMAEELTKSLEGMYPDDQTTEEWLNRRYFEEWTAEEEEAEGCECGDYMMWEINQPVDEFLDTVDRIRDFVNHQKKG